MSDHEHDHEFELPPMPQHMIDAAAEGCEESKLLINRRNLLGLSAGLFAWAHLPRHAEAAGTEPRLLIVLMRGGMDGLHVAPPLNDPYYAGLRGKIAYTRQTLLGLTSDFGLNPAMPKFKEMFDRGDAAMVQAIAPPLRVRSHFEGLYNIEAGLPGDRARSSTTGWLNRLLTALPPGSPVKADCMHIGPTPLILAGPAPVLAWSPGVPQFTKSLDVPLTNLYSSANPYLEDLLRRGLAANTVATTAASNATRSDKGITPLQLAFRGTARLMNSPSGPRIAVLNIDGWDTHVGQTSILTSKLGDLDSALEDFQLELGAAAWNQTAVVCVTEMGRTAKANGNEGTDHGDASVAFLVGGAIAGGRVLGQWPGLAPNQLTDGRSLAATTDMRAVFKGLLQDHLGVPRCLLDTEVFPGSAAIAPMQDLLKSPKIPADPKDHDTCPAPAPAVSSARSLPRGASMAAAAAPATAASAPAGIPPRYETALARFRRINGAG